MADDIGDTPGIREGDLPRDASSSDDGGEAGGNIASTRLVVSGEGTDTNVQEEGAPQGLPDDKPATITVSVRRKNDTFYDDYLHRGEAEDAGQGLQARTPLAEMSYYEYGMYVRIVVGDPWALKPGHTHSLSITTNFRRTCSSCVLPP